MDQQVIVVGLVVAAIVLLTTGLVVVSVRREGRRISEILEQRHAYLDTQLHEANLTVLEAQREARQLQEQMAEQRPEKLVGKLEQATKELEQVQHRASENERQVGQLKQELLHQSEQHEQQRLRLEQERQHLMEEVDRWHGRYGESQLQITRLEQELSDAQQKVDQLAQLRERLLADMREVGTNTFGKS